MQRLLPQLPTLDAIARWRRLHSDRDTFSTFAFVCFSLALSRFQHVPLRHLRRFTALTEEGWNSFLRVVSSALDAQQDKKNKSRRLGWLGMHASLLVFFSMHTI